MTEMTEMTEMTKMTIMTEMTKMTIMIKIDLNGYECPKCSTRLCC